MTDESNMKRMCLCRGQSCCSCCTFHTCFIHVYKSFIQTLSILTLKALTESGGGFKSMNTTIDLSQEADRLHNTRHIFDFIP